MEATIEAQFDEIIAKLKALFPTKEKEPIIPLQPVITSEQPVEPIPPPEPIIPLQPVIALEQPIIPPQPRPEPLGIEKEKEISTSSISDAKPYQASSAVLRKIPLRCQLPVNPVLGFQIFAFCSEHFAPSTQFGSLLACTRYAEEMEATGQG